MGVRLALAVLLISIAGCAPTVDTDKELADSRVPLDFTQLMRRKSPNDYLVCPVNLCQNAKPDRIAPEFPISSSKLRVRLNALLKKEPRTRIVADDGTQVVIEQRSAVFRFPDLIDIELIDLGSTKSTVAIFSRSKYGYYDLGANERRVVSWLRELGAPPEWRR
jgi:uncharacterized protein (DUF1499 family)